MTGNKKKTPDENVAAAEIISKKKKNTNDSAPIKRTIMTRSGKRGKMKLRKKATIFLQKSYLL